MTNNWIQSIALLVPGLNLTKWQADRSNSTITGEVAADAQSVKDMIASKEIPEAETPTLIFAGPKGTAPPVQAELPYSSLKSGFKIVS